MTIETRGTTEAERNELLDAGYEIDFLGGGYWNVICDDDRMDALTNRLDNMSQVEWRLV